MRTVVSVIAITFALGACSKIEGTDAYAISKAKKEAAYHLIDPDSAKFRDVVVMRIREDSSRPEDAGKQMVCGQMNGKNRNGAYTGFTRFMYMVEADQGLIEPKDAPTERDMDQAVARCKSAAKSVRSETDRQIALSYCGEAEESLEQYRVGNKFRSFWGEFCEAPKPKEQGQT